MARHYDELSHRSRGQTRLERHLSKGSDSAGAAPSKATPVDALIAARRRFLKCERVDMNELATELGVGRATLYRWVGDREQLLGEVLWSMAQQGLAQCRAEARGKGANWVLAVYRRFGDIIVDTPSIRYFAENEPEAALRVMTTKSSLLQSRVVGFYADLLDEAAATKGLKLRLDSQTLAFVLIRIAESFLWTDLITGEEPDLSRGYEVARVLLA